MLLLLLLHILSCSESTWDTQLCLLLLRLVLRQLLLLRLPLHCSTATSGIGQVALLSLVYLSFCLCFHLPTYLSVCLPVCLSVCRSVYLSLYILQM